MARLQSGGEQTFSNWTRVIIRRRTFSTFSSSNWENFDESRARTRLLSRFHRWWELLVLVDDCDLEKGKSRIVKGLKFTCDLHSRSWNAGWGTWIDLVQEIGQLGRWRVLEWTWADLWIGIEWVWYIFFFVFWFF